jgi:hypothetical protein
MPLSTKLYLQNMGKTQHLPLHGSYILSWEAHSNWICGWSEDTECIHSFVTNPSLRSILLSNFLDHRMVKRRSETSDETVITRISCIQPLDHNYHCKKTATIADPTPALDRNGEWSRVCPNIVVPNASLAYMATCCVVICLVLYIALS